MPIEGESGEIGKPHQFVADKEDAISCGACGASLEMTDLPCPWADNVSVLRMSPDYARMMQGEITPEDYARRLSGGVYGEPEAGDWDIDQ